jgi:hypothetical protein
VIAVKTHTEYCRHLRPHPVVLLQPIAVALGGVAAAGVVGIVRQDSRIAMIATWVLALFLVLRLLYLALTWVVQAVVITGTRLILMSGFFSLKIVSFDIQDLRYCTFERSYGGRLLGYGTISFESGTRSKTLVDFLPYPERMYLLINGIISPELTAVDRYELDDDIS